MTTREKGTGLGLAIVRKVIEDHGGAIELLDAPQVAEGGQGAMLRIVLPATADGTRVAQEAQRENDQGQNPTKKTKRDGS